MDFFSKSFETFKSKLSQLTNRQFTILLLSIAVVFISFIYLIQYSSQKGKVLLYKNALSPSDFQAVKEKLDGMNVQYSIYKSKYFFVKNEEKAVRLRSQIGMEGLLRDIKGFELFDNPSFSVTDFERKVNFQRAVTGNIVRHLESLDDIDKADVVISFTQDVPFYKNEVDASVLTASVSITVAAFSDLRENKKKLKGLRNFIANGVDQLEPQNVLIIDKQTGTVLSSLLEVQDDVEKIRLARDQLRIKNYILQKKIKEIKSLLSGIYTEDRYELIVDLDIDWNTRSMTKKQIDPIILKQDNPNTPYDESQVVSQVVRSQQEIKETWKGPSFIPEGPPGVEPNVSPGAKQLIDRQLDYEKLTDIKNNEFSESNIVQKDPPYKIKSYKIALALDGVWKKESHLKSSLYEYYIPDLKKKTIERKYFPVADSKIKDIKNLLEGVLSKERGDKVEVKHIQFDRTKEFENQDLLLLEMQKRQQIIFYSFILIPFIILLVILYRVIRRYLRERRRIREAESKKKLEALEAMKQKEDPNYMDSDSQSLLQEDLINIAKERPEFVANLVKVWLLED